MALEAAVNSWTVNNNGLNYILDTFSFPNDEKMNVLHALDIILEAFDKNA